MPWPATASRCRRQSSARCAPSFVSATVTESCCWPATGSRLSAASRGASASSRAGSRQPASRAIGSRWPRRCCAAMPSRMWSAREPSSGSPHSTSSSASDASPVRSRQAGSSGSGPSRGKPRSSRSAGSCPASRTPVPLAQAVAPGSVLLFERGDQRRLGELAATDPPTTIVIGPEGGFAPTEVEAAERSGAIVAGLGPRILRSRTVAAAAAAVVLSRTGDFA